MPARTSTLLLAALLPASSFGLRVGPALGRRAACERAAAAAAATLLPGVAAVSAAEKRDPKAYAQVVEAQNKLKSILESKEAFISGLASEGGQESTQITRDAEPQVRVFIAHGSC